MKFGNSFLSKVEYPDATTGTASTSPSDDVTYTYDALGEKISMTDQNGTTHGYSYDSLGRQILDAVTTLGTGVDGSVLALGTTFNAQGLPSQETSYANAAATTVVNQDEDIYNGLGQLIGEYQSVSGPVTASTTPEVQYGYSDPSTGSVQTSMTYPNGRVIEYTYNSGVDAAIGRVSGIADAGGSDAGNLQSYSYLGNNTIVGEVDGNGVTETTTLDNFGRTSQLDYVNIDGVTTDDFQYGYDQDGNVLYQLNGVNNTFSQLYTYDSLNRLTSYTQGTLSDDYSSITGTPTASQAWTYDALGNQDTVTTNGTAATNTTNSNNELTSSGTNSLAYDNDGNTLTDENGQIYTYNAWNQMVSAKNAAGATLATYTYDTQGRRVTDTESGTTTGIYYSNQWQDIEERQSGAVTRQNVWGLAYVNQLVERDDNSVGGNLGVSGSGLGERLYAEQDLNWSVVSLVDASGNVVQRASFAPYGQATFLTATWSPTTDAYNEDVLFQGGRLETVTGLYEFQARDYDPQSGTWKEQDPLGPASGGNNLYQFGLGNPNLYFDSTGLKPRTYKIEYDGQHDSWRFVATVAGHLCETGSTGIPESPVSGKEAYFRALYVARYYELIYFVDDQDYGHYLWVTRENTGVSDSDEHANPETHRDVVAAFSIAIPLPYEQWINSTDFGFQLYAFTGNNDRYNDHPATPDHVSPNPAPLNFSINGVAYTEDPAASAANGFRSSNDATPPAAPTSFSPITPTP